MKPVQRFAISDDGQTAKKLSLEVEDGSTLDLSAYRGSGADDGEELMDEEATNRVSGRLS